MSSRMRRPPTRKVLKRNCPECMEEFQTKVKEQTFCCKTCGNRAKAKAARRKARVARPTRICPICNESFKLTPRSSKNKYCSKTCSNKGRPNSKVSRTCRQCKTKFEVYPSYEKARGRVKFCSVKCRDEYRQAHMTPKLARSYVDNLFSRLVRRRDGCCLYCGTTEHLQCAHIISRAIPVLRADLENAITLCYRHHIHWWHKDPIAAARWFEARWPGRYDGLIERSEQATKVNWKAEFDRLRRIEAEWDGQIELLPRQLPPGPELLEEAA